MTPELSTAELLLRLGLTVVLCALIGLEREIRGQIAGLRTHILVGLGAALWMVAAIGMAVGAGYYLGATVATGLVLVSLVGFRRLRPLLVAGLRTDVVYLDVFLRAEARPDEVFALLGREGINI